MVRMKLLLSALFAVALATGLAAAQTHFTFISNTGNNATVAVPTSANPNVAGTPLANGDEIGAFTPAGLCVGAIVWANADEAITVWGDDDQTPAIDGIRSGEQIYYRVWRQSTNTEFANVSVGYSTGNGIYAVDGIYILSSLSVMPGPAVKYLVTSSRSSPIAGETVGITAQLADSNNLPVPTSGKTVTWSKTGAGGSFASATSTTDANGVATVVLTTSTVAGTVHTVTATDNTSLTGTSGNITTVVGPAAKYVVTSSRSRPVAGDTVMIRAQLADANNNPVATAGKDVTWSKTGAGGSFASATSTTDANGVATVVFTTSTVAGTVHTVTATDNTSLTGTSGNTTTIAGPATKYLVTSSRYSPVAGDTVMIRAQLADTNNNPVSTAGKTVTWSKTGAGGSFASATSTTNSSGVASVVFTTGTVAGTVHTVTATDNTSLTGTSGIIITGIGLPAKYIVTSSRYGPVAGDTVTIRAQLADVNNNAVGTAGRVVTWSKTGAGGSFASPTSTTDASGVATVVFTTGTVAGTVHTVTAMDNTSLTGTSGNITTVVGPAAKYVVTSSNYTPAKGTGVTITAQLADSNNNPVATAGKVVTWSSTNGGSFSSPTSTTNSSGVATVVFTTSTTVGTVHTVTATDTDNLTGTSANIVTRLLLPPEAPTLWAPRNGSMNVETRTPVIWFRSAGATSYRLQVSTSSTFSSVLVDTSGLTDTSHLVIGLSRFTTYYWRVNGTNAGGTGPYSAVWNFTTIPEPPPVPRLASPSDNAAGVSTNPRLHWNASSGAESYRLQVSVSSDFSTVLVDSSGILTTSDSLIGLANNRTYYWRVSASNAGGTNGFSPAWRFTTVLAAPTLASPSNAATNQSTRLTLTWNGVSGAVTYRLQVSTSSTFTATVFDDSTLTVTSKQVGPLANNTTHYWRAKAKNTGGTSSWSSIWSFATVLAAPTLASPSNDTTGISTSPTLRWHASTGATSYRLQLDTNSAFSTATVDSGGISDTSFSLSGLLNETTYYWHVRASNAGGASAYSDVWSFSTAPAALTTPIHLFPPDRATGISTNPTLRWNAFVGATSYRLQVAKNTTFSTSTVIVDRSAISDTFYRVSGLSDSTTYYWHVNATHTGGTTAFSTAWSFRTVGPTSVERTNNRMPTAYKLSQNYPNPFNPVTTIEFSLPKSEYVVLTVYDILGAPVGVVVSEYLTAGHYSARWDATNVASGIYYYRLVAGPFVQTKKMSLVR